MEFLQQPQAAKYSYEFQSGGIVELLKKLKKKFSGQLNDVVTAEQNSAHNYELMKMNLDDEIENSQSSIDTKTTEKAEQEGVSADAQKQLVDTRADLAAMQKYLKDMHTTFALKKSTFEQNQEVRGEEIKALSTAIEIISGESVSGSASKHLPSLAQKSTSFLQIKQKTEAQRRGILSNVSKMLQER